MGWFRNEDKDKIPEKLRAKTPEQIVADLEQADKDKIERDALKADAERKDKAVGEAATALTEMRDKIKQLEANQKEPQKREETRGVEFGEDPERYVSEQINKATLPIAVATLRANAQLAREQCRRSLQSQKVPGTKISKAALFDRYSGEIDTAVKTVQLQHLQESNQWLWVFNNILGQKMDEVLQAYSEGKGNEYFVEPGSTEVTRIEERKTDKLTDEEALIAKRMRVTPEEYLKQRSAFVASR